MPVSLPPPPTPHQSSYDRLQEEAAKASTLTVIYRGYRLHIFGDLRASPSAIKRSIRNANSVSNAVRAVGYAIYEAGYPVADVVYALSGKDLYISVHVRGVASVDVPPRYRPYFNSLTRKSPLTDTALVPAVTLASELSSRGAQSGSLNLTKMDDHRYRLDLSPTPGRSFTFSGNATYGNPGNRFVGRYFGGVSLFADSRWGDELNLETLANSTALGFSKGDATYRHVSLTYDRITPVGLFTISGDYTPFRSTVYGLRVHQEIDQGTVSWINNIYADFNDRVSLELALQRTRKNAATDDENITIQSQIYNAFNAGLSFLSYLDQSRRWRVDGAITFKHGLSHSSEAPGNASLSFFMLAPSLQLLYKFSDYWAATTIVRSQWSVDRLPEQEQWVLGGTDRLAAYLPGVAVGDRGVATRVSVHHEPVQLDFASLRPAVFVEYGIAGYSKPLPGQPTKTQQLSDVGLSLTTTIQTWMTLKLEYAHEVASKNIPTQTLDASGNDVFFNIGAKF